MKTWFLPWKAFREWNPTKNNHSTSREIPHCTLRTRRTQRTRRTRRTPRTQRTRRTRRTRRTQRNLNLKSRFPAALRSHKKSPGIHGNPHFFHGFASVFALKNGQASPPSARSLWAAGHRWWPSPARWSCFNMCLGPRTPLEKSVAKMGKSNYSTWV